MIISYPTGLYQLKDAGNVTFTVSNNPPPRSNLLFPKVPEGIYRKQRTPEPVTLVVRKQSGELIFTVSKSGPSVAGSNLGTYVTGQVLDFGVTGLVTVEPMLAADKIEIRHDSNILDSEFVAISPEDRAVVENAALEAMFTINDKLNAAKQLRADLEISIQSNQKSINQTAKTLEALKIANSLTPDQAVTALIVKLELTLQTLYTDRTQLIVDANTAAKEAGELTDQLRAVGQIVS